MYDSSIKTFTSTKKATAFANLLAKMSWMQKKEIWSLLGKSWRFSEDLLRKVFKNDEKAINNFLTKALTDTRLAVKNEWTSIAQEASKSALDLIYNAIRGTAETQIYREGK